jgi:uncharacterized protein YqeY
MALEQRINDDLKQAMLAKDAQRIRGIRAIKSAILLANTAEGRSGDLTNEEEIALLQKLVKQRRDSAQIYTDSGRPELAQKENEEITVIESYLPKQLSPDEIKGTLQRIITEVGAKDMKDMGKVMGLAAKAFAGQADNKTVADLVKQLLSQSA